MRSGDPATLVPMDPDTARAIADIMAVTGPWARFGRKAEDLARTFSRTTATTRCWCLKAGAETAGAMVIEEGWLIGSYLKSLAILPEFQGRGLGRLALEAMQRDARENGARNLWVCVSTFNARALTFYEAFGFARIGILEGLLAEGLDEVLMRKQLAPAPKPPPG